MYLAVEAAYALQRNTPILVGSGRPSAAVDQTTINLREVSRFYPVIPPVPLISTVLTRTKPNLMILLRAQPDPTIPMNNRPSFSRRLAGATKTPLRPPDSPRSRPRPLVSPNGNSTSHAELGPREYLFAEGLNSACDVGLLLELTSGLGRDRGESGGFGGVLVAALRFMWVRFPRWL